ncbi:MAG: right-handed parallel beta-helix repeat-containing protein [Phycisphaerales bacterium]|nr:right-handed parallel beta-helix repeat-containing protein [Phycisphaerales bacterium]
MSIWIDRAVHRPGNRTACAACLALACTGSVGATPAPTDEATVLYVNAGVIGGAGDGTSWENAFSGRNGLQAALAAATGSSGPISIWVASGVYAPAPAGGPPSSTFMLEDGVALLGGFVGVERSAEERDPTANPTILTGDLNDDDTSSGSVVDNVEHVVRAEGVGPTAVVDGFVIERGRADGGGIEKGSGGGLLAMSSSPTIAHCVFRFNYANWGGGGAAMFGGSGTITACTFSQNKGDLVGGAVQHTDGASWTFASCQFDANIGGNGAGIFSGSLFATALPCTLTVSDCAFVANSGLVGSASGIGINAWKGTALVERSIFHGNTTVAGGGGMYLRSVDATIRDCDFVGNEGQADGGGGVYVDGGDLDGPPSPFEPHFINCRFVGNNGAMLCTFGGVARLTNCTVAHNTIGIEHLAWPTFAVLGDGAGLHLENTIVWGNQPVFAPGLGGILFQSGNAVVTADSCDVQSFDGTIAGEGSFALAPDFVDAGGADDILGTADDDVRLAEGSPCVDAGLDALIDGLADVDLDGNPRVADGDGRGGARVDVGAYELPAPPVATPDLDGDGDVDGADLGILLGSWGPCGGCPADLNGDGQVDGADLGTLLAAWDSRR